MPDLPPPQEHTASPTIFVGIDIAICSATHLSSCWPYSRKIDDSVQCVPPPHCRMCHIYQHNETGPYANPLLSRASDWAQGRGQSVWPAARGQQQDKTRPQSPATCPETKSFSTWDFPCQIVAPRRRTLGNQKGPKLHCMFCHGLVRGW